jgi:hypothetical protein
MASVGILRGDADTLALATSRVERRLGIALALLLLGIAGIVTSVLAGPIIQYAAGPEIRIAAGMEGDACGSHLSWAIESRELAPGSRVEIVNDSVYWRIPVVIERERSDGSLEIVAESPVLDGGQSWTHTFWRSGSYRIASADETQRRAGLDLSISVH